LGGKNGWYLKENEHYYVYDMFSHGKVIAQPQALNKKSFGCVKISPPLANYLELLWDQTWKKKMITWSLTICKT
jgi:hypothetical protein